MGLQAGRVKIMPSEVCVFGIASQAATRSARKSGSACDSGISDETASKSSAKSKGITPLSGKDADRR